MAGIAPLGFGEFPDDHNPEFMSLRLNAMGNSFLDGIESLPIIGDSRFTTALTSRLRALAQAIKSAARPIFSRFLNVMRPKSTSELGLSAAQHGAVPLGSYSKKNDVLVTSDSLETVAMRLDLVRNAEQRILLSGNYCGGRVFNDFLDAVEQRMAERPALEVFVLSSDELLEEDNIERVQRIQERYPGRLHFQRTPLLAELAPTPRSIENHVKMMVVDEKYWVVGGTGMAEHLCTAGDKAPEPQPARIWSQRVVAKATRDMDVIGKGAAAQTLALEFFKLWAVFDYRVKGDPDAPLVNAYKALSPELPRAEVAVFDTSPDLVHTVACKVIVCGPEHPTNACTDAYIERLQGARRSVRLGQMNVNPGPELRQALYNLPESVHCDLITTGVEGNSPVTNHFFAWTNFRHYQPLLARGAATLYEYDVPGVLYHKKVMTVDERYTLLGSYNLSQKSDCSDYELLMEIDSRRTTQRVNDVLDRDTKLSREVSPQEVQERNKLRHRILAAVQRHLLGSFIV